LRKIGYSGIASSVSKRGQQVGVALRRAAGSRCTATGCRFAWRCDGLQVRVALRRKRAKVMVQKIICQPDAWWALVDWVGMGARSRKTGQIEGH
jgi:hypothetical protein